MNVRVIPNVPPVVDDAFGNAMVELSSTIVLTPMGQEHKLRLLEAVRDCYNLHHDHVMRILAILRDAHDMTDSADSTDSTDSPDTADRRPDTDTR